MHTVFKFNRGIIVTNTSKYNLAEGLDLKKPIKVSLKIPLKRYLICSTRALDLLCQVRACMPIYKMYVLHFNLSTYVHQKVVIINTQCVQVKCISRLFAENLNDFNIHLFGQTV